MHFKRLEIFGFKSFADKTVLNFEPGITAIVGPNGCGKSNIFDSIRWVLGEQSVKELRGSDMEDVIFNGTEKKPSLGFAEVSLTLSNESKSLPIEYDEVTITRRLFRSGESEYLLNKTVVRLRDIHELLMGTGIGAEAYSLIQQGKVDLVVNSRAEDRRQVLDEAAGITKYKAKKKEALNKLKDTENNLLRVNDITIEVKRQIASIERQATKARKYKEEFEKLKDLELKVARWEVVSFSEKRQNLVETIAQFKEKEETLTREWEEFNGVLTNEINFLSEIEQKINELHADEIKLDNQIDVNSRQLGFNEERIQNIFETNEKLLDQKNQLIRKCSEQQVKVEAFKAQFIEIEQTIEKNNLELKEKQAELSLLERQIKEAKDKIKDHEEKILALTSRQVNLRNELTDVMKEMQGSLARKRRLDMETQKVSMEREEINQKLFNIETQIKSLQGVISDLESQKENKLKTSNEIKVQRDEVESTINDLEKKKFFFKSQKEFIEKLHTQYQDMPDPIVEGYFITQSAPLAHHTGIIGKVKEVQSQNLAEGSDQNSFKIICETKFVELDPQQIANKIDEISLEIETLVVRKNELNNLWQAEEQVLGRINDEIYQKEKAHTVFEAQRKGVLDEVTKLVGELELVDLELGEVVGTIDHVKKKEDELNFNLDTITQEIHWCKNDVKDKQDWITHQLSIKEEKIVYVAQMEKEIESNREKLNSQNETLLMLTGSLDEWLGEIKRIDDEGADLEVKKNQYLLENEQIQKDIEQIKIDQESLTKIVLEYQLQKDEKAQKINSMRANMNSYEDELETIKQQMHSYQLQEQQLSFNEQTIKDRLLQAYKVNFDEFLQSEPQLVVQVDMATLQQEVEILRKRCESFGVVNLVAIEEFEELKQRFEFLTKQQADLLEAKSQLMDTINKINRSTRQLFMDTFTKVSEEFRIYFRMLFGGGEAQLVLMDPENVLESGIEIVARPPGKKLQNISLLSGGEKTLTAIALIFGIFKVNPSPFCVLDEIDAALDESNVGRFSYLLQDFAKIAQFIVITHNKKTIASADVMYGITMPETGVSRIVSVKFHEGKKEEKEELVAAV